VLADNEALLDQVAALFQGTEWNGHNHEGAWSNADELEGLIGVLDEALSGVVCYSSAEDYFGDFREELTQALVARGVETVLREELELASAEWVIDALEARELFEEWLQEAQEAAEEEVA
jgi:hypothetical protein